MHFLYVDEAGNTGADLNNLQQPVFTMAGLVVSDEKWRKTRQRVNEMVEQFFNGAVPNHFELHAAELLSPNGGGPFEGRSRDERNALCRSLLELIAERSHYIFQTSIYKSALIAQPALAQQFGFDWHHPWEFSFEMILTMFEDFLRGPNTGQSSAGLAIIDHEDASVQFVRAHTARRQKETGWRQLKKVVEIGYSASSHANAMIQLTDLVAFARKKYLEIATPMAAQWPQAAKDFYTACNDVIWERVKFKNLAFQRLNVHCSVIDHAKAIRQLHP